MTSQIDVACSSVASNSFAAVPQSTAIPEAAAIPAVAAINFPEAAPGIFQATAMGTPTIGVPSKNKLLVLIVTDTKF